MFCKFTQYISQVSRGRRAELPVLTEPSGGWGEVGSGVGGGEPLIRHYFEVRGGGMDSFRHRP